MQEIVRSVFFLMGGRISDSCTLEETLMATNVAIAHWTLERFKNRFGEQTSHAHAQTLHQGPLLIHLSSSVGIVDRCVVQSSLDCLIGRERA